MVTPPEGTEQGDQPSEEVQGEFPPQVIGLKKTLSELGLRDHLDPQLSHALSGSS